MKYIFIVLLAVFSNDPREIAKINALKKQAKEAFLAGNFDLALSNYIKLYDSMGVDEDEIKLNIAHAYYNLNDTANAKSNYSQLGTSTNNRLKSIAYQQLGVLSKEAGKLEHSLQQLKSAIKSDPTNQAARYDYEVVKKLLEEQQNQDQEPKDQEPKDQDKGEENQENQNQEPQDKEEENQENQDQENQDKEGKEKESEQEKEGEQKKNKEQKEGKEKEQEKTQEEMTKEKLKEMNISEEKAQMILEAMKNNEIQYLQQQKRKATERPPSDKPDW